MPNNEIAIVSTVVNRELYQKSAMLFPASVPKFVIDGTNGMHALESICYMMKKLRGSGIKWLIMADEDVLFINPEAVFSVIEKMKSDGYSVSGVRDGGVLKIRSFSPFVINTFFSILNFEELEKIWDEKEVRRNQYIHKDEFGSDFASLKENFDAKSLYEPYYCFYFWLLRKGKKILFLNAETPLKDDQVTTLVKDTDDNPLLYHTWYARSYGSNDKHTERISNVLNLFDFDGKVSPQYQIFKSRTFYFKALMKKNIRRIGQRVRRIFDIQ